MKKLIALLLSVLLALTSMAPAYAAKPYLENQNFSIEASIDELADKGYKIGGRLTVWTANTSNPSQSKRYATYDVNSTLYPSDTLDIFSESYNANI